ncbi:MAG TPA: four helix bundle protein [Candidatus Nitrosocosmicus sp.]|nr:four helix bundle protein [Candidatus Nitrosocosmicus sp.]
MTNQIQNPNTKRYDLKERTSLFGKKVITFVKKIALDPINRPVISQLVRSATSIGANYMEADGAVSKKDFRNKIAICNKESKETMHWLHMMSVANPIEKNQCRTLWKESHELALIFSSILRK